MKQFEYTPKINNESNKSYLITEEMLYDLLIVENIQNINETTNEQRKVFNKTIMMYQYKYPETDANVDQIYNEIMMMATEHNFFQNEAEKRVKYRKLEKSKGNVTYIILLIIFAILTIIAYMSQWTILFVISLIITILILIFLIIFQFVMNKSK